MGFWFNLIYGKPVEVPLVKNWAAPHGEISGELSKRIQCSINEQRLEDRFPDSKWGRAEKEHLFLLSAKDQWALDAYFKKVDDGKIKPRKLNMNRDGISEQILKDRGYQFHSTGAMSDEFVNITEEYKSRVSPFRKSPRKKTKKRK